MPSPKYKKYVEPHLSDITRWIKEGATEALVCTKLGVSVASYYEYKKNHIELSEAVKNGKQELVKELKGALYKKAVGFTYEEIEGRPDKDGKLVPVKIIRKQAPPDVAAINLYLKNIDRGSEYERGWSNDPELADTRREELELKKQEAIQMQLDTKPEPLTEVREVL